MDAKSEMEPMLVLYCAMFGADEVARGFVAAMEDLGKGDAARRAFREHEEGRERARRGLMDELGDGEARRN
jgi:hypothetical protein